MKSREQSIIHIVNEVIRNMGYAQERNYDDTALPAVTRYTFLSLTYLLNSFQDLDCTS